MSDGEDAGVRGWGVVKLVRGTVRRDYAAEVKRPGVVSLQSGARDPRWGAQGPAATRRVQSEQKGAALEARL